MTDFCAITPDRGDRPNFLRHCVQQMLSQTLQPGEHIVVNRPAKTNQPDLVERVMEGLDIAKRHGFSRAYIIENDDYYPDDYFQRMETDKSEFVGVCNTIYYHLTGTRMNQFHPGRSSLFATGFDISALDGFKWPERHRLDLDILLWQHAASSGRGCLLLDSVGAIGIKHGIGLCGGRGHSAGFGYSFSDMPSRDWLRNHVRPSSFDFYMSLIDRVKLVR